MITERRYRHVRALAGSALVLLSVLIAAVPLCHHLGYEFSLAVALVIPWVVGPATIAIHRRSTAAPPPQRTETEFRGAVNEALSLGYSLLAIPVAVATLSLFAFKNCSYAEGVAFFALLPGVTVLWAVALASFCCAVTKRGFLLYALLTVTVLLHPVYIGYTTPQIYAYNLIFGYFPGFSYDEALRITPTLLAFRVVCLAAAFGVLILADVVTRARGKAAGTAAFKGFLAVLRRDGFCRSALFVSFAVVALAWIFRTSLGFESTDAALRRELSDVVLTDHFEIRFRPGAASPEEKRYLADMHEYRYEQVERALELRHSGRVVSYIYPDAETKRRWVGTATTNIAKPWRGEMHLMRDSWEGTLKHELVHVLAADFGMPVIKAHYNTGLVEGLATAVDGAFGNRTLDEYAAAMFRFGIVGDPAKLIRPVGFAIQSSSVSYVAMGSFCRFLIDRYGIGRFKQLYGGEAVDTVYARPYGDLVEEWRGMLAGIAVPDSARRHVEYFFRRPSIFAKECARAVANLNEDGFSLLERKNPVAAAATFRRSLAMSWNTEAFAGLVRSASAAARYDSVVALIRGELNDTARRPVSLFLLYGDALWMLGDTAAAEEAYGELLRLDLSERLDEAAALRRALVRDPALNRGMIAYFTGALADADALPLLDSLRRTSADPHAAMLEGRLLLRLGRPGEALFVLRTPAPGDALLARRFEVLIAEAALRQNDLAEARAHYARALTLAGNKATAAAIADALQRCAWLERRLSAR